MPESRLTERRGFDLVGALSVTGGLIVLVYAIVKVQAYGWVSAQTIGLLAVAVALLATFVVIELRSRHPLVRLDIFRTRSLTAANTMMLAVGGGMFAIFFFATLYVQEILHLSPVQAGLGFLPLTAGIILASGIAQQVIGRVGVLPVVVSGMALASAGLVLLSRVSADGSYASDVLPGLVVMAVGLGLTFVPLTLIGTTNVANSDAGLASGLFNTSQQVGGALGLASPVDARREPHGRPALGARPHRHGARSRAGARRRVPRRLPGRRGIDGARRRADHGPRARQACRGDQHRQRRGRREHRQRRDRRGLRRSASPRAWGPPEPPVPSGRRTRAASGRPSCRRSP